MKLSFYLLSFHLGIVIAFKLNLKNIMTSHLINQSFKKHIHNEIINSSDIMKHLEDNHLDNFYIIILSSSFIYTFNHLKLISNKPYHINKPYYKRFELLILTILFIFCKNIENAT
jgi:hypothetical protein